MLSSNSARVQWRSVNCLEANGLIERYTISYRLLRAEDGGITVTTTNRVLVISDLEAGQQYSVQVAAENSFGVGPPSEPIFLVLIGIFIISSAHNIVYLCTTCYILYIYPT